MAANPLKRQRLEPRELLSDERVLLSGEPQAPPRSRIAALLARLGLGRR